MNWTVLDFSVTESQDEKKIRTYAFQAQVRKIHAFELTAVQTTAVIQEQRVFFCREKQLCETRLAACLGALGVCSAGDIEHQMSMIDYSEKAVCLACGIFCTVSGHKIRCPAKRMVNGTVLPVAQMVVSDLSELERLVDEQQERGGLVQNGVLFGFSDNLVSKAENNLDVADMMATALLVTEKKEKELGVCSKCYTIQRYVTHGKLCGDKLDSEGVKKLQWTSKLGFDSIVSHLSGYWVTVIRDPDKEFRLVKSDVKYLVQSDQFRMFRSKYGLVDRTPERVYRFCVNLEYVVNPDYRCLVFSALLSTVGIGYTEVYNRYLQDDLLLNAVRELIDVKTVRWAVVGENYGWWPR